MESLINIVKELFPKFYKKNKIQIWISALLVALSIYFFNSNLYKYWRYYDDKNISIKTGNLLFPSKEDDKIFYKYFIFFYNKQNSVVKVSDIRIEFQTRQYIQDYNLELNDIDKNSIEMDVIKASNLLCQLKEIKEKNAFAISINCYRRSKAIFESDSATVNISYKILDRPITKFIHINPHSGKLFIPNKSDIIFDIFHLIDHRKNPKFHFTYDYCKFKNKSDDRQIRVYCSDNKNKYLRVKYSYPSGTTILESERSIHTDFDPIRIQVLSSGIVNISSGGLGPFRTLELSNYFKKATKSFECGNYNSAIVELKKVVGEDPQDYRAWFKYGLCLDHIKKYELAISALESAIKAKGDYFKAYGAMGDIYYKTNDEKNAELYLRKAIDINSEYAYAYFALSLLQKKQGKNEEALNNLNLALKYESRPSFKKKYKRFFNEFK